MKYETAFIRLIENFIDIYFKEDSHDALALKTVAKLANISYIGNPKQSGECIKKIILQVIDKFGTFVTENKYHGFEDDMPWGHIALDFTDKLFEEINNSVNK